MDSQFLERQNIELRKELSGKELKWEKERALFLQKIEHMEIKMNENNDREIRLKDTQSKLLDTVQNIDCTHTNSKMTNFLLQDLTEELKLIRSNKDATVDGITISEFRKNSCIGNITPDKISQVHSPNTNILGNLILNECY